VDYFRGVDFNRTTEPEKGITGCPRDTQWIESMPVFFEQELMPIGIGRGKNIWESINDSAEKIINYQEDLVVKDVIQLQFRLHGQDLITLMNLRYNLRCCIDDGHRAEAEIGWLWLTK